MTKYGPFLRPIFTSLISEFRRPKWTGEGSVDRFARLMGSGGQDETFIGLIFLIVFL
jgi:type VI protein secretion system component VasF